MQSAGFVFTAMRRAIVTAAAILILPAFGAPAATVESPSSRSQLASALDIKIETSRTQPTVGTGMGVIAEIQNVSSAPIYLREKNILLSIPPELQGPLAATSAWWGLFPTQHTFVMPPDIEPYDATLTLKPGATYRVQWTTSPLVVATPSQGPLAFIGNMWGVIASELNFVYFSPGDYKVSVIAEYWLDKSFPPGDYATSTQTATIRVAAPQSVILLGAALGGLVAYFIFPLPAKLAEERTAYTAIVRRSRRVLRVVAGMAGAMLFSAMVTILLSRISETQFLIRITVNDFWGAIAVGFIANWAGTKIIEKFLPRLGGAERRSRTKTEEA